MKWLYFCLIFSTLVGSEEAIQNEISRLQAFKVLNDHQAALEAAQSALEKYPKEPELFQQVIILYAKAGIEEEMMRKLRMYQKLFPEKALSRDLMEEIAWGVIEKGSKASTAEIRAIALIAASLGNDAKGVAILASNLADQNAAVRGLAAEFASHFRDARLQEAVLARLALEADLKVRLQLLLAIGKMHIVEAENELFKVLENERSLAEERVAAIKSLLLLKEAVERKEIEPLIKSSRAGLRALAGELIRFNAKIEDADLLLPLLQDSHAEVRNTALCALGELRVHEIQQEPVRKFVDPLLNDTSHEVAISAAWVVTLLAPSEGQKFLSPWLKSKNQDERLYAVAALVGAGKYGFPLTLQVFKETDDFYLKMNLALALIQQKIRPELGAEALYKGVMENKERWMQQEYGSFIALAPCDVTHRTGVSNYPEAVNQTTRLGILNELAILNYPGAHEAIQYSLKMRPWGVSGSAAALLLTEGDEEALALIRELLKDPSEKVQLQAALVLGQWGSDSEALVTLQTLYPRVSKSQKGQILEALGKIGEPSALPFLLERLEEPFQVLRMIAALAIIQTLYH